jgi:hypothetical protein
MAVVALFQVAFNFRYLNRVQLAIDVGMNDFQYFLTTQLETSTAFLFSVSGVSAERLTAVH